MKLIGFAILALAITAAAQTEVVTAAAQTSKPASSPKKKTDDTGKNPFGTESKNEGPITTEIYADEASFDSGKNVGVFTGHVKVFDPRFNLQSDKLTVYLHKGKSRDWRKPSRRETSAWCVIGQIPTAVRRRTPSAAPSMLFILQPMAASS